MDTCDLSSNVFVAYKEIFGALLGAVVGSLITNWGQIYLEKWKSKKRIEHAYEMLTVEVSSHQSSLARVIDSILPLWIHRGNPRVGRRPSGLEEVTQKLHPSYLKTIQFKNYSQTILFSDLSTEIENYYSYVESLNDKVKFLINNPTDFSVAEDYVRDAHSLLEGSIDMMNDLLKFKKKHTSKLYESNVAHFNDQVRRYRLFIAICKESLTDLMAIKAREKKLKSLQPMEESDYRYIENLFR